ncbi:hypothetical protein ACFPYJ_07715 [Paenibacillus solisilvae]|uniref:Uncharacterized protein n=1 Tax=Paenibacillus solisilvae TaxID=2486751 RepID=A0ABW0VSZ6_9BACL
MTKQRNTPYYDMFLLQKSEGNLKPWEEVTEDELIELFIEELIADSLIALIWDIDSKKVTAKRYGWNIKTSTMKPRGSYDELIGGVLAILVKQLQLEINNFKDSGQEHKEFISGLEYAKKVLESNIPISKRAASE